MTEQRQIDARARDARYGPQWHNLGDSRVWWYADRYALAEKIELGDRVTGYWSWPRTHGHECHTARGNHHHYRACERGTIGCTYEREWQNAAWAQSLAFSIAEQLDIALAGYMWRVRVTESDWDMGALNGWVSHTVGPARDQYAALELVAEELRAEGVEYEEDGTDPPALRVAHPCEGSCDWNDGEFPYASHDEYMNAEPHGWDEIYAVEPA